KKALIHHTPLPYVIGNTSEFRQLFQNLISNSLKFSKQGVQPVISISAQESSGEELTRLPTYDASKKYMSIRFVDNGIGFEEEYAEKIFVI
ncbi:ATP-binding protein, partial [Salmonella enterica subsp. enterica serovar Typhimurium]|nr:ATP-binding protein [Salmonella enterica subsp. enterica serovar Typhimurium]